MSRRQRVLSALKYAFSFAIIVWMIKGDFLRLDQLRVMMNVKVLVPSAFLMFAAILAANERFLLLLRAQAIEVSRFAALKLTFIGLFFNFLIPGGVGGDVMKAYYLKRKHGQTAATTPYTVIFDRVLGLYILVMIASVALVWKWNAFARSAEMTALSAIIISASVAMSALLWLAKNRRAVEYINSSHLKEIPFVGHLFGRLVESVEAYNRSPNLLTKSLIFSFLGHMCSILIVAMAGSIVAKSMGLPEMPFHAYLFIAPLGFMLSALPVSPAGIGVGQAAFFFLFNLYLGQTTSMGPTVATIYQTIYLFFSLAGLYFYLRRKDTD